MTNTATATKPRAKRATAKTAGPDARDVSVDLELHGNQAQVLFKAARIMAPFASNNDARMILTGVRIACDGKRVRIEATDSYRLARLDLVGFDGLPKFDVIVKAKWLVANLPKGNLSPAEVFKITIDGGRFEVSDRSEMTTASIAVVNGSWPNTDKIFDGNDDPPEMDGETERAFNPLMLASVFKAAAAFGGDAQPLRIRHLDPLRPCRFDVIADVGTLTMLLMPVRCP